MSGKQSFLDLGRLGLTAMLLLCCASAMAANAPFEVFAVSDTVRVFEDGYGLPDQNPSKLALFALRNEDISGQCVIRAHADLSDVKISVGRLERRGGAAVIPAENVAWNFVQDVFLEKNTPNRKGAGLLRPAPARFPDVLTNERQCSLGKNKRKAVYLTIRVPRQAEPGEYRAAVTVSCGEASVAIPLTLTVYPLVLPSERHLTVTEWLFTDRFEEHHGIRPGDSEAFFAMLRKYAENMADHRQNMFRIDLGLIKSTLAADGKLHFDFSKFDKCAQVFWDTGRMDCLETGFVARFGKEGWFSHDIVLRDFPVREEATNTKRILAGKEFLPQFLPAFVNHLREKGWLRKTLFHICDEPSNHNIMSWREASDFVHRHAPELRRIDAIEASHCLDRLEVWVPKLDYLATWRKAYEDAQRRGNELWYYTVGIFQNGGYLNKTVDVPLIESRLMHWLNYRYGLTGYLHWGLNHWTPDPVNAPGAHCGDAWHVYPTKNGLLNSLRWEQMRNGIQDYECLWLLENKIAQIKQSLSPRAAELIEPSRRGVEIASQVVRTYRDHTKDPAVMYAAKRQAIEETLALDESPRAIIQTTPREHSAVAPRCVIGVYGWVEPSSSVTINGKKAVVAADGLFLEQAAPSDDGSVALEIQNQKGRKSVVRKFVQLSVNGQSTDSH